MDLNYSSISKCIRSELTEKANGDHKKHSEIRKNKKFN